MRTLSGTLKKSYFQLICLFSIVLLLSLSITGKYLINSSKQYLRNPIAFLRYCLDELIRYFPVIDSDKSKTIVNRQIN